MFSHSSLSLTLSNSVLWYLLFTDCSRFSTLTTWNNRVKSIDFILTVTRSQEAILFEILFFFFICTYKQILRQKGLTPKGKEEMRGPHLPIVFEVRAFMSALCLSICWKKVTGKTLYKKESYLWLLPVSSLVPRQIREVKDITKMGGQSRSSWHKSSVSPFRAWKAESPKCKTGDQRLSWEIPRWFLSPL